MANFNRIQRLYQFYASDLSIKEIEKLIKRDLPELYDFYASRMKQPEKPKNSLSGIIYFIKNLFLEFLNQLTPVRRVIYSVALIFFVFAIINDNWNLIIYSFLILNLLLAFELADKLTAKNELAVAREIQNSLMPKSPPKNNYFEISACYEPAKEVGGDYYDFINYDSEPDKIFIAIGDISGKGMAAAIYMVQVQTILRNIAGECTSPKSILTNLNKKLKNILSTGSFFTISLASMNSNGTLHLCRAGHLPLIHFRNKSNDCVDIIPSGIGIGLTQSEIFSNSLEQVEISAECGDVLVFFTDGVVESMNGNMNEYGIGRLKNIIIQNAHKNAKEIQQAILDSVKLFQDIHPANDDLTMIIMKAI
ncbi:MAG: PP2C family protein-serine/threonine phosphatase [Ignavibacteriaceae bacterium]